jgi:hypothetical protein
MATGEGKDATAAPPAQSPPGALSGVWLSRYEYFSTRRNATLSGEHFVVAVQHGARLTVNSLPGSTDSPLSMNLEVDQNVVTGTWAEQTSPDGYYRGARYHGALQFLLDPTGQRLAGRWVGFGKDFDVETGPWEMTLQDSSTSKATLDQYNRPPGVPGDE